MLKKLFFKLFNYTNPHNYEKQYDNDICKEENEEIRKLFKAHIPDSIPVTDIGCGTGMARSLLTNPYIGIDRSEKLIDYCRENHDGRFMKAEADLYAVAVSRLNPIFIFSLDYLDIKTIETYIQKTDKVFLAVHYDRPYLSQTSVYSGRRFIYNLIHPKRKRKQIQRLFQRYGGITYPLSGEPFYSVTVIEPDRKP